MLDIDFIAFDAGMEHACGVRMYMPQCFGSYPIIPPNIQGVMSVAGVALGGVYYTLRNVGFLVHTTGLHGFDLASGTVKHVVELKRFARFGDTFAEGVWGLAADHAPQGGSPYFP